MLHLCRAYWVAWRVFGVRGFSARKVPLNSKAQWLDRQLSEIPENMLPHAAYNINATYIHVGRRDSLKRVS